MGQLSLKNVVKTFGMIEVVKGVNLDVSEGEFIVFVGPSGCGKSTLLRMIAGLEHTSAGDIVIDGKRVNDLAPVKRGIAMVFQSYALYPHMTVFENIAFPLRVEGASNDVIRQKVEKAAAILHLDQRLQQRPGQLSGGQRQRVAIGRAIVRDPQVFLFDEPLSNLDAELRVQTRVEIAKLHADIGATMIYVTHDQVEAMTLADRIVVLRGGKIEQAGTPLEIYNQPANRFVAGFIGSPKMNFLEASVSRRIGKEVELDLAGTQLVLRNDDAVAFGVRPEHLKVGADCGTSLGQMTVTHVEQLGGQTIVYGRFPDHQQIVATLDGQRSVTTGDQLPLSADLAQCHVFDAEGRRAAALAA